ncbi:MAG: hypothetical protein A3D35_02440 [Candidatus Staskawiczbacteria bacterium RIFCSPHIGHO2_02_FULL_34_9]|uniref:Glycosyltransferase 2-like domain-containing protein n=1 Tax=Candidatus Staskawiczbacteria bacterium RIFCSPHIGHO2_02_FULL_34_9 TaxID=1802206 RepID=A0A1G2HYI5_9BACT|nr:MAG: hypothetical protein A3D35_02440 [Candidatus Staskawiczbacteria bacterium RIFCSPHIGHO2_02_FULL_34_9]
MKKHNFHQNKISAFVAAYHEDKLIERCLKSLQGVVDEIIVIHDGLCQDKTLEIARKYTDLIFEMPENKGVGDSHNIFAFNQCSFNWVLVIDADEYLSEELRTNISELVKNNNVSAYSFIWPMWDGQKYISKNWPYKKILFQKKDVGLIDKFHHGIIVKGLTKEVPFIIHHQPLYNNYSKEVFDKKAIRWSRLQARDHLATIESREIYNFDIEPLKREQQIKDIFYRFPFLCAVISSFTVLLDVPRRPYILFQKGLWLKCKIMFKYTYNVAKEVGILKNKMNRDFIKKIYD